MIADICDHLCFKKMKDNIILLGHGSGGRLTHELIKDLFVSRFGSPVLSRLEDSGVFNIGRERLALTTDSYVVNPLFFPGSDIGKLAVYGTVNDLSVCGAKPVFISCAFIVEEGLKRSVLEKVAESIKEASRKAGVRVITGDTKVVERRSADKLFINTSGIGVVRKDLDLCIDNIRPGDDIIINGSIGDHGISVLSKREGREFKTSVRSDCAPLNDLIFKALKASGNIRFMRDPTRGGVATVLIVEEKNFGILVDEKNLPVKKPVKSACELLGLDPLYIGNEGKVIIVSPYRDTKRILSILRRHRLGRKAQVIGKITTEYKGKVCIKTKAGGIRLVDMLTSEQLPRIC